MRTDFYVERIHKDAHCWIVQCADCGNEFEATRADATYCSGKCRTHASRLPARIKSTVSFIEGVAIQVGNIAQKYPHNEAILKALMQLKKAVDYAIEEIED